MSAPPLRSLRLLLALALFSSGAAALTFEGLWFRQASLAFGNSVWASALVTAAFMAGMGIGSLLVARVRSRASTRFAIYAALELLVGVTGVALVLTLPALSAVFAPFAVAHEDQPLLVNSIRLGAALAALLVPSAAMGATLPLALGGLRAWGRAFGATLGATYGANTLGAMVGALATELVLLERLGTRGSALVAGALSVCAASLALVLARRARSTPVPIAFAQGEPAKTAPQRGAPWLLAAALAGCAMLGLEVVWLRMLMLFLSDTPLAFAVVLALVLGGLALGSLLAGWLLARAPSAADLADRAAYVAGGGVTLGLLAYPYALSRFYRIEQDGISVLLIALPLVALTAIASGCLFPLVAAARAQRTGDERDEAGMVFAANTFGAALGATGAALWVLPTLGMERGFLLFSALFGLSGLTLGSASRPFSPAHLGGAAGFVASLLLFPHGALEDTYVRGSVGRWMGDDDQVVTVREGLTATLVHVRHRTDGLDAFDQLATNSYSMSANDFAGRRYMKLFAYLPLALHEGMESALVVGYGLGNTVKALTDAPEFRRIDVVDTSPDTLELGRGIGFAGEAHPLDDERIHRHVEDGRHYLHGTSERYDLITGEPPPPFLAGVESLYTAEYFALARERLNEGGFATYWLPLMNISGATARSIVAAFCSAFDDCSLWHGADENYMLMGSRGARGPVSLERFVRLWSRPHLRGELAAIGLEHPVQLGALFIGDAPYLRSLTSDAPVLSDEFPRRMLQRDAADERHRLVAAWHDTSAARTRFLASPLVAGLWPKRVHQDSSHQFESQRLLNDLLSPRVADARTIAVLDQVLTRTPWTLPVYLLLNSDPDVQRSLAKMPASSERPEHDVHRLAARLVKRDYAGALAIARRMPAAQLPIPELVPYLERAASAPDKHKVEWSRRAE